MAFIALQPIRYTTPDARVVDACAGDVLEGFTSWPPNVQTALLEMRRAAFQGDALAASGIVAPNSLAVRPEPMAVPVVDDAPAPLTCPECDRADFANAAGLARHRTRAHGA